MAKRTKNPKKTHVRWEIHSHIIQRIATYQRSHNIKRMEVAANIILDKATENIKPIDL